MSGIPAHIRGDGQEPAKPAGAGSSMRIFDSAKKKEIAPSPTAETGVLGRIIDAIKTAIVKRGVGLFRTEAHVARDIEDGINEAILDLKRESIR